MLSCLVLETEGMQSRLVLIILPVPPEHASERTLIKYWPLLSEDCWMEFVIAPLTKLHVILIIFLLVTINLKVAFL